MDELNQSVIEQFSTDVGCVLVLAYQPSDEVCGCGGALGLHLKSGQTVRVVITSMGDTASAQHPASSKRKKSLRRESRAAGRIIGYGSPVFWNLTESQQESGDFLAKKILELVNEMTPVTVYAPSNSEEHPGRRALAFSVIDAISQSTSAVRLLQYECAVPLQANTLVDISAQLETKKAAMSCFKRLSIPATQEGGILALNRFRAFNLGPDIMAAEAFRSWSREELLLDQANTEAATNGLLPPKKIIRHPRPLVSVIVRSMDRPSLPQALDSISAQTWPHLEIVVVNAKGQGHAPLSSRWGRLALRIISGEGPLQRSRAANVGLLEARGDYLCFLDDDDLFQPEHISSLMAGLQAHPSMRAAYAGVRVDVYEGRGEDPVRTFNFNDSFSRPQLWGRNFIPMHAMLFERSLVSDEDCRFDESLDMFEDWDFWLQLSRYTDFLHIDQISAIYRNQGASGLGDEHSSEYKALLVKHAMAKVYEKWKLERTSMDWVEIVLFRDNRWEAAEYRITALCADFATHEHIQEQRVQEQQAANIQLEERVREQQAANIQLEERVREQQAANIQLEERVREQQAANINWRSGRGNSRPRTSNWRSG